MQTNRIKDLPPASRPYEKCEREGAAVLTDAELLAVILGSGCRDKSSVMLADDVLSINGSENGLLNLKHVSFSELVSIEGIGRVKALKLLCIGELSSRIAKTRASRKLDFQSAVSVAAYYMEELRHLDQECAYLMLLDARDHLRKELLIAKGSMQHTAVSPREIFKAAIQHQACGLILVHNHPSGDPMPSSADLALTERLFRAGMDLGVCLRDHIIIGDNSYFSFLEAGFFEQIPERSGCRSEEGTNERSKF